MIGVLIAAGLGSRMGPFTEVKPKCLLPVGGRALIDWTIDNFRRSGCKDVVVVVGHRAETISRPDIIKVMNAQYHSNNILHSLMHAAEHMTDAVVASYSDIYVEPFVYDALMSAPGDIVLAVDLDWRAYYDGRTRHPLSEAENIHFDSAGHVRAAGKHLTEEAPAGQRCGEFIGLWRMTKRGSEAFRSRFEILNRTLSPTEPFQHAREWRKAYITDMIQDLVDQGVTVHCALVERGWAELDTEEDYQRLPQISERQRLATLIEGGVR